MTWLASPTLLASLEVGVDRVEPEVGLVNLSPAQPCV